VRGSHIKLGEGERKVRLGQDSLPNKAEMSGDYVVLPSPSHYWERFDRAKKEWKESHSTLLVNNIEKVFIIVFKTGRKTS
jgi:hypothetical protein